jgi:ketosteroid isomerase-like protein
MKTRTALSILLLLGVPAWAGVRAQSRTSEEDAVRSLDDQERMAALKRDVTALERLWSDQFTVNAPNNEVVVGRRAVLDTFVRSGIINFLSFERKIEFVRVDGGFAIVMGAEVVRPAADAPMGGQTINRRFTNIWKKEAGTWRLFARHANVIPAR